MKVLIAYCYSLPHVGGLWTYVHELKQSLEKKGHSVAILAADPQEKQFYLIDTDQSVRIRTLSGIVKETVEDYYRNDLPKLDSWLLKHEITRYSFELAAAYFDLEKYDLIHSQDSESTLAISRVKPKGIPLISTFHCSNTRETFVSNPRARGSLRWKYVSLEESLAVAAADNLIVPSNWLRTTLQNDYRLEAEKIHVIPHGIDTRLFFERMKEQPSLERKAGVTYFACVARLAQEKGHTYLLEALAKLKEVRQDWVCWLVGDGYLRKKLAEQRDRLQLQEHVVFTGSLDNVPSVLKLADFVVMPSLLESLGYAAMEAQLAGKPVVATDAGGLPEVVTHMKTGLISPARQSEPLFQNIRLLLENRSLMKRISANAKRWALKHWSIELMVNRTLEIYQTAIERGLAEKEQTKIRRSVKSSYRKIKPFSQRLRFHMKKNRQPKVWKIISRSLPNEYRIPDRNLVQGLSASRK